MQIHDIQPNTKPKKRKRIGRGGKRGTYSGKGIKGQKCRAGAKMQPMIRELIKRYPKLRGYKFSPLKSDLAINISVLDKVFEDGATIDPKAVTRKGLTKKGGRSQIKILGKGETKKKFFVKDCSVSQSAREIIEKAGGSVGKTQDKKNANHKEQIANKTENTKKKSTKEKEQKGKIKNTKNKTQKASKKQ